MTRHQNRLNILGDMIFEQMPETLIRAQALLVIQSGCGSKRKALRWIFAIYLRDAQEWVYSKYHAGLEWLGIEEAL